jgi:hypothetical protein
LDSEVACRAFIYQLLRSHIPQELMQIAGVGKVQVLMCGRAQLMRYKRNNFQDNCSFINFIGLHSFASFLLVIILLFIRILFPNLSHLYIGLGRYI